MKKLIILIIFFGIVFAADKVLTVHFTIDKQDNIEINKLYIVNGTEDRFENKGPYAVQLIDEQGNILRSLDFDVDFILYTDPPKPLKESGGILGIRYNDAADKLVIKHNDKIIYSENITGKFCNKDSKCNNYENIVSCPNDCTAASEDGYCTHEADAICDPDCAAVHDPDCPENKTCIGDVCYYPLDNTPVVENTSPSLESQSWIYLAWFGLIFVLLVTMTAMVLWYLWLRRANKQT